LKTSKKRSLKPKAKATTKAITKATTKAKMTKRIASKASAKKSASKKTAKGPQTVIASVDLTGRSPAELKRLKASLTKQIEKQIASQKNSKLREAYDRMVEVADEYNTTIEKVLKACKPQRTKTKKSKVAPKYRNKSDPSQTWSGRGQEPVWMREAIAKGAKKDDFLIK